MQTYEPTVESVSTHQVPDWFHDAKLGIFVHYGLYSVPGWAVASGGGITQTIRDLGWAGHFRANPYSEWYLNTLRIRGSPTWEHHRKTYGAGFSYDDFVEPFNEANARWRPEAWAELFARVGARYVVLTSKHCESFLLWPAKHANPYKAGYSARRDIVGELASAVCSRGMRMGLYYFGGFDWCFNTRPITAAADLLLSIPRSPEYVAYCTEHWNELIDRYEPSVMWGDVGYPAGADVPALFAHYYNRVPDGVVNDRFYQASLGALRALVRLPGVRSLVDGAATKVFLGGASTAAGVHSDFATPEYHTRRELTTRKWEACRGLGYSFGYNRNETAAEMIAVGELVRLFVDIVSKNGNLLLDVGPMADGTIPELQRERLEGLGAWLAANGEAIFGTRPWSVAEGVTSDGVEVRYTRKGDALYAILLGAPAGVSVTIRGLRAHSRTTVRLVGTDVLLAWQQAGGGVVVTFPARPVASPAVALKIVPTPVVDQDRQH